MHEPRGNVQYAEKFPVHFAYLRFLKRVYIVFWSMQYMIQYRHQVLALSAGFTIIVAILSSPLLPSFAQQQQSQTGINTSKSVPPSLENTTSSNLPVLEKTSDKGIYKVRLLWPQAVAEARPPSLQVQIDFLNASTPVGTNATVPQRENISGGSGIQTHGTAPSTMDFPLTVKSYDIIIYSSDGKELWKKTDQPGLGGRGTQQIVLNNNYTGPVTIEINKIQPGWNTGGANMTDSVKFAASIVPEFPIVTVALPLTIAIAATVIAMRFKQRLM